MKIHEKYLNENKAEEAFYGSDMQKVDGKWIAKVTLKKATDLLSMKKWVNKFNLNGEIFQAGGGSGSSMDQYFLKRQECKVEFFCSESGSRVYLYFTPNGMSMKASKVVYKKR